MTQIATSHVTTLDEEIGARVDQALWRRRQTQTALAAAMGIPRGMLSRKVRGERRWYAVELAAVAEALGVTIAYLYGAAPDPLDVAGAPSGTRTPNPLIIGQGARLTESVAA